MRDDVQASSDVLVQQTPKETPDVATSPPARTGTRFPFLRSFLFTACLALFSILSFIILKLMLFCNLAILVQEVQVTQACLSIDSALSISYEFSFVIPHKSPVNLRINPSFLHIYIRHTVLASIPFTEVNFERNKSMAFQVRGKTDRLHPSTLAGIVELLSASAESHQPEHLRVSMQLPASTTEFLFFKRSLDIPLEHTITLDDQTYRDIQAWFDTEGLFSRKLPVLFDPEINETDEYAEIRLKTAKNLCLFEDSSTMEWSFTVENNLTWLLLEGHEFAAFRLRAFQIGSRYKTSAETIMPVEFRMPFKPNNEAFAYVSPQKYPSILGRLLRFRNHVMSGLMLSIGDIDAKMVSLGENQTEIKVNSTLKTTLPINRFTTSDDFQFLFGLAVDKTPVFSMGVSFSKSNEAALLAGQTTLDLPVSFFIKFLNNFDGWSKIISDNLFLFFAMSEKVNIFQAKVNTLSMPPFQTVTDLPIGFLLHVPTTVIGLKHKETNNIIKFTMRSFNVVYADGKIWNNAINSSFYVSKGQTNVPTKTLPSTNTEEENHLAAFNINDIPLITGQGDIPKFVGLLFDRFDLLSLLQSKFASHVPNFAAKINELMNSPQMENLIHKIAQKTFKPDSTSSVASKDEQSLRCFLRDLFNTNAIMTAGQKRATICKSFFENMLPILLDSDRFVKFSNESFIMKGIFQISKTTPAFITESINSLVEQLPFAPPKPDPETGKIMQSFLANPLIITTITQVLATQVSKHALTSSNSAPAWQAIDNVQSAVFRYANSLQMAEFMQPEMLFGGKEGLQLDEIPPVFVKALEELLTMIFQKLSVEVKAAIYSAVLALPSDSSEYTIIGAVVAKSGAVSMQKLFQLLGDNMLNDELVNALQSIKSSLPAMPHDELLKVFYGAESFTAIPDEDLKKLQPITAVPYQKIGFITHPFSGLSISPTAVGSATISQGHRGFLSDSAGNDIPVFMKIMKESAYKSFLMECHCIDAVAALHPAVSKVFTGIKAAYVKEFDFLLEISNMQLAKKYYKSPSIKIPEFVQAYRFPLEAFIKEQPKTCHMMVMEFVNGITLDRMDPDEFYTMYLKETAKFSDSESDDKAVIVSTETETKRKNAVLLKYFRKFYDLQSELYKTFTKVGLLESGFIHGDLHAGNIFFQIDYKNADKTVIVPIDYGNCHQLSPALRAGIIQIGIGVAAGNANDILKGLGYPDDANVCENERVWKKILGDIHYYLEFHTRPSIEKKEFFIGRLKKYNLAYHLYQIEHRIYSDLSTCPKYKQLTNAVLHHKALVQKDTNIDAYIDRCGDLIAIVENCLKDAANEHDRIILVVAKRFFEAVLKIKGLVKQYRDKFSEIINPTIRTLEQCIQIEKDTFVIAKGIYDRTESWGATMNVFSGKKTYTATHFKDFMGHHDKLLQVLNGHCLFNLKTGAEAVNPIEKLKVFLIENFDADGAEENPSEEKKRFIEYLEKNEIRYLNYIRDHIRITRNEWEREKAKIAFLLNHIGDANYQLVFREFFIRAYNFRMSKLPKQECVSLVTSIPAWSTESVGTGHEIMNYFRSEASLANGLKILKDVLLKIPGFSDKLPDRSELAEGVITDWRNIMKPAYGFISGKIRAMTTNYTFEWEKAPRRPKE